MELFSQLCDSMLECMDQPAEGMTIGTMTESAIGEASNYSPGPPPPPASSPIPDVRTSQLQKILKTVEEVIEREKPVALQSCELNMAKMRIFGCLGSMAGDEQEFRQSEVEERARFLL